MNNSPKRHHYIPQFILRNFTDECGKLHCFNKETRKIFSTSPAEVFAINNLYTQYGDGATSTQVETELSQIEEKFSRVIGKIIEAARLESDPELESSDEDVLRQFIDCQINRHPYNRELLEKGLQEPERLQSCIEDSLNRPLNNSECNYLYNAHENNFAQNVFAVTSNVSNDSSASWMPYLKQKQIGICKVRQSTGEFVIGDRQIVRIPSETGDTNFANPGVWLLYPISYDVGVVLWGLMERKLNIFGDPRWTIDINKESFSTSQLIVAGRSKHQIQSLLN